MKSSPPPDKKATTACAIILFGLLAVFIGFVHGVLPLTNIKSLGIEYSSIGKTLAFARDFPSLRQQVYGLPHGVPEYLGLPYRFVAAAIMAGTGLEGLKSHNFTGFLILLLSYACLIGTLVHYKIPVFMATAFGALYFLMPITWGHRDYGIQQIAFSCIPLYLYPFVIMIGLASANRLSGPLRWAVIIVAGAIVMTWAVFMDGYSFAISVLLAGVLSVSCLLDKEKKSIAVLALPLIGLMIGVLCAFLAYRYYLKSFGLSPGFKVEDADYFRAFGVDLITVIMPNQDLSAWAAKFNYGFNPNPSDYFSDGSSVRYNYLGFVLPLLACLTLFRRKGVSSHVKSLGLAGIFCFVLAMGPSLKINDTRSAYESASGVETKKGPYMPREAATVYLGSDLLYTKVPVLNSMRAVYRWMLGAAFACIILAAAFSASLGGRLGGWVAAAIWLTLFVDFFPDMERLLKRYQTSTRQFGLFEQDVLNELSKVIPEGSRIMVAGDDLEYMAPLIASHLNASCYNACSDKQLAAVWRSWPSQIQQIKMNKDVLANGYEMMNLGQLDWLILPYFNMRWDSYTWPPAESRVAKAREFANNELLRHRTKMDLVVHRTPYFDAITIRKNKK